ncbi:endonuclease/exonuclease/phosphatase family protein [Methyloligella solikamskensis]|uniref:Endonuclease/exonuclease/phosphatase family protein n=1 Tax=Methyloligella solikamskensis TaxID=1177756 RepID=A0ABW3J864_9HYPH
MSKLLKALTLVGLVVGLALTGAILVARVVPALDIVSNGLPVLVVACFVLFLLAAYTGPKGAAPAALVLLLFNAAVLYPALQSTAQTAEASRAPLLKVATLNVRQGNDEPEKAVQWLRETDPDVIVLQEMWRLKRPPFDALLETHPFRVGDQSIVILSKQPIGSQGKITRVGFSSWNETLARWAQITIDGVPVEIVAVHPARPFYPELQQNDMDNLTRFVQSRHGPLVVAGDFNQTPWTNSLQRFTDISGLGRLNTYHPTWPMRRDTMPFVPLLPIDNIFISSQLAMVDLAFSGDIGSDHRGLVAELALAAPRP